MKGSRKHHKSSKKLKRKHPPPPSARKIEVFKQRIREATLNGLERGQTIHELKLDTTPEGIVAFSKLMIEKLGRNQIDVGRSTAVKDWVSVILKTNESGIEAVKQIEENALHLAETVRVRVPNTPKS